MQKPVLPGGGKFLLIILALSLAECQNQEINRNQQISDFNYPENRNGILFFSSLSHTQDFFESVSEKLSQTEEPRAILGALEESLNFTSLRSENEINFREEEEEFSIEEIIADMNADFINDDLVKALLNPYYEVGIENDVYVFYSNDQIYKISDGDFETLLAFRALPKGLDKEVPLSVINSKVQIEPNERFYLLVPEENDTIAARSCPMNISILVSPAECNPYLISLTAVRYCGFPEECVVDEFILNFGDGSPEIVFNDVSRIDEIQHTYSNTGTYRISLRTEAADCPPSLLSTRLYQIVDGIICTENETFKTDFEHNDFFGIGTKVWWNKNIFGTYAGAFTHAYQLTQSARWRRSKQSISVTIDATFRKHSPNCGFEVTKTETDSCNSCKKKRAAVRQGKINGSLPTYASEEVHSTHSLVHPAHALANEMVLEFCD